MMGAIIGLMGAVAGPMMRVVVGLMGAGGSLGALCSMGDESSRERIIGLMGAVVGSMGGDVVGSMIRAIVCLMGHWPGGLMESSRERIIGLMEAIVGSMGAMVGSMGGDVVGSMGAIRSMGDESSRERIIG